MMKFIAQHIAIRRHSDKSSCIVIVVLLLLWRKELIVLCGESVPVLRNKQAVLVHGIVRHLLIINHGSKVRNLVLIWGLCEGKRCACLDSQHDIIKLHLARGLACSTWQGP